MTSLDPERDWVAGRNRGEVEVQVPGQPPVLTPRAAAALLRLLLNARRPRTDDQTGEIEEAA
jgi:hypothetical protein